jgi:hypothetical protein
MSNEDSDDEYYKAMLSNHKVILQRGHVTRISDKDFIRSWQLSNSLEELNQILGISNKKHGKLRAKQRANDMRRNGVPLKELN